MPGIRCVVSLSPFNPLETTPTIILGVAIEPSWCGSISSTKNHIELLEKNLLAADVDE